MDKLYDAKVDDQQAAQVRKQEYYTDDPKVQRALEDAARGLEADAGELRTEADQEATESESESEAG